MQKALCTILFLVYFVVSTGFTVNLHYCMDRYHSWKLGASTAEACGICGMPTTDSEGCCRDEVKTVKLQQDLLNAKSVVLNFSAPALVSRISTILITPFQNWNPYAQFRDTGPPLLSAQETYLENCVFRL